MYFPYRLVTVTNAFEMKNKKRLNKKELKELHSA